MASNFPSSLDSFTNPSSTDAMDSVSVPHATQHSNLNDAVEALQAKVGADSSGVVSSHDYKIAQLEALGEWTSFTPSWNNVTIGNATESWYYAVVGDVVFVEGQTVLGSTSTITGLPIVDVPVGTAQSQFDMPIGQISYTGNGIALTYGFVDHYLQGLRCFIYGASTTYVSRVTPSATVPWSGPSYTGSVFRFSATYRKS